MHAKKRSLLGLAGLTAAASAGMLMFGAGAAFAAQPTWEPDPQSVGTLSFFDASGNQVTSGSTLDPLPTYVVGSVPVRAGADNQADVFFAQPDPAQTTLNWFQDPLIGNFTPYPVTSGPSNITSLPATTPVYSSHSDDETLDTFRGDAVHSSGNTAYDNVVQIRVVTAAGSNVSQKYDDADLQIDDANHTWTQIYPAPKTNTNTTLTAAPSPATVGQSVTLTATEAPATAGSVQFIDGTTDIGSAVAVNTTTGVATTSTSTLAQGSHSLSAVFTPTDTTTFNGSTGTTTLTVNPPATATTTALAVTQDNTAGDPATLTATVTGPGSTPNTAGTVSFFDNNSTTPLNSTPVTSTDGTYTLNLPTGFAAGSHSVVAKFSPSDVTQFAASQSQPQTFLTQAQTTGACSDPASHCTDVQNIQVTVPVGTLTINTPYTSGSPLDLGTMALDPTGTYFTANAPFNNIVVTDTRSGINGVNSYTVSALASPLTDGKSNPGSIINAQNVGLTGVTGSGSGGFAGVAVATDNPAAAPPVGPTAAGNAGLGGTALPGHTVLTVTNSVGTFTSHGTLTINAPTSTEAGLFTGTITFTVG